MSKKFLLLSVILLITILLLPKQYTPALLLSNNIIEPFCQGKPDKEVIKELKLLQFDLSFKYNINKLKWNNGICTIEYKLKDCFFEAYKNSEYEHLIYINKPINNYKIKVFLKNKK